MPDANGEMNFFLHVVVVAMEHTRGNIGEVRGPDVGTPAGAEGAAVEAVDAGASQGPLGAPARVARDEGRDGRPRVGQAEVPGRPRPGLLPGWLTIRGGVGSVLGESGFIKNMNVHLSAR